MLEKKECWDGGLTRQHLLKTMSGIFKKRDKSQAKGVRLDADIVTGKRLARKIVQVSGVMVRAELELHDDVSTELPPWYLKFLGSVLVQEEPQRW